MTVHQLERSRPGHVLFFLSIKLIIGLILTPLLTLHTFMRVIGSSSSPSMVMEQSRHTGQLPNNVRNMRSESHQ